jgi:hypothetical protein
MVNRDFLVAALRDLGHVAQVGPVEANGWAGNRARVDLKIPTRSPSYDIGFRKTDQGYEVVADWYGIPDVKQMEFLQKLNQRYAYHAARAKLKEQGFDLVTEENKQDGQIHLVLRRMA